MECVDYQIYKLKDFVKSVSQAISRRLNKMREGIQIISLELGAVFYKIVNSVLRRHEEKCLTIDAAAP
jgi:hypothetical protein